MHPHAVSCCHRDWESSRHSEAYGCHHAAASGSRTLGWRHRASASCWRPQLECDQHGMKRCQHVNHWNNEERHLLTHWPLRDAAVILETQFPTRLTYRYHEYFPGNFPMWMPQTTFGKSTLVPVMTSGNKLLPKPMLTHPDLCRHEAPLGYNELNDTCRGLRTCSTDFIKHNLQQQNINLNLVIFHFKRHLSEQDQWKGQLFFFEINYKRVQHLSFDTYETLLRWDTSTEMVLQLVCSSTRDKFSVASLTIPT